MPAHRRRSDTYEPHARVPMSFRVRPALKARMEQEIAQTGRSLMREVEHIFEWYFDHQDRMGGPRLMHLLQSLAEAAQETYPDNDAWLDNRQDYSIVLDDWFWLLQNSGPVDVAAEIEQGRQMIAELPTLPRHVQWRIRRILAIKAELTRLPPEVRAEFAAAAELPAVERPTDEDVRDTAEVFGLPLEKARQFTTRLRAWEPAGDNLLTEIEDTKDKLIEAAQPFMQAWAMAAQILAGAAGRLPDEQEIAAHFATSPELQIVAGLHTQRSAERLLYYRSKILRLMALPDNPEAADDHGAPDETESGMADRA